MNYNIVVMDLGIVKYGKDANIMMENLIYYLNEERYSPFKITLSDSDFTIFVKQ